MTTPPEGNTTPASAASSELTVAAGLEVVILNRNEVLVQSGTRSRPSELLRDTELRGFLGPLMARLLEGPASADDLLDEMPDSHRQEARQALDDLRQAGFVVPADHDLLTAYLRYSFGEAAPLGARSVALFGAGPLGSRIGASLLQHGLGTLTVIDPRKTDPVWRRFAPHGFHPEATAAAALRASLATNGTSGDAGRVRVQGSEATFEDVAGLDAEIARHDLAVVAFERPHLRLSHLVNRIALKRDKPWLLAQIDGSFGIAGPLFLPPDTACYNCFRTLLETTVPSAQMAERYRRHLAAGRDPGFFPGLPAHCELLAAYASLAAVHYLVRRTSFLVGRALMLDFGAMSLDLEDVLRLPRCPSCMRSEPAHEPPFASTIIEAPDPAVSTAS